ncbi:MAG: site-specific integrase [Caldilineaceae bacterium]
MSRDYKPKLKTRIKRAIKWDEVQQLLDSINGQSWIDARDRALISLLFRTGLRRGEAAGLCVPDINFTQKRLLIHADTSKGAADGIIPFDDETATLLQAYLACRPAHPTNPQILWYANDGYGGVKEQPLTGEGIYQVMKRRCDQAGLPRFAPQTFRRGFGTALLNVGVNIGEVSALLRHSSVKITETWYVEHELQAIERVYRDAQERLR